MILSQPVSIAYWKTLRECTIAGQIILTYPPLFLLRTVKVRFDFYS